jgi:hypothetical protein
MWAGMRWRLVRKGNIERMRKKDERKEDLEG